MTDLMKAVCYDLVFMAVIEQPHASNHEHSTNHKTSNTTALPRIWLLHYYVPLRAGCCSYSLTTGTCLKKHAMQHVRHVTGERGLVLSSTSSCIQRLLRTLFCFLLPAAVAPVGAEAGMYTQSQPGPSAACKCLPECDTFFIGHGPLCNVVMFYADREERATGRQTAFMNLVKWLRRWHCTRSRSE